MTNTSSEVITSLKDKIRTFNERQIVNLLLFVGVFLNLLIWLRPFSLLQTPLWEFLLYFLTILLFLRLSAFFIKDRLVIIVSEFLPAGIKARMQ